MSDAPKKRSRAWIGWALVAVFVLYPLSIGPAYWWASRDRWETLDTMYAPLNWLAIHFECVRDAMGWYVSRFNLRPGCAR
jgi:hypothetical protein